MRIIAHRANLDGPDIYENSPESLFQAIIAGFDVELDVRLHDNKLYLGHDRPQYVLDTGMMLRIKDRAWLHCKNFEALDYLNKNFPDFNYFWHDSDKYTITSKGFIWAYPGEVANSNTVVVLPETTNQNLDGVYAICTDYPRKYKVAGTN